jgi:subtilisin family serine protease
MVQTSKIRVYATLKNTQDLLTLYRRKSLPDLTAFTLRLLDGLIDRTDGGRDPSVAAPAVESPFDGRVQAVSAPSLDWRAAFAGRQAVTTRRATVVPRDIEPDELIIAYEVESPEVAETFLRIANANRGVQLDVHGNQFLGAGTDAGASVNDHWCPGTANLAAFGHREHVRRTVRAGALADQGLRGQSVNVVIIDEGLDKNLIPPANWGGGLDHFIDVDLVLPAGSAQAHSHGMMIARSILDLAPNARLYDVPAIPTALPPNVQTFISTIQAAYTSLIHEILYRRSIPEWSGPWVLINAWGIFDTRSDPTGSYTRNTEVGGHPMINRITRAVATHNLDIVFAAGNCGQFCPSQSCGGLDRGPGHSIWGANAHPLVITVGAVRSDETWTGYSSQGPGPELLAVEKPDFCAPSQFVETYDAALLSSGTSAACGVAGGVVAALRSNPAWDQFTVTPQMIKAALMAIPRKPDGLSGWDDRFGCGVLNAEQAIAALP